MNETPIVAVPASAISNFLKRPLAGDDFEISCLTVFPAEQSNSICFLANLGAVSRDMDPVQNVLVITPEQNAKSLLDIGYSVITSDFPKYDLASAVKALMLPRPKAQIHESAVIGPDVEIGKDVTIGPHCVLEGRIVVGDNCVLGANNTLMNDVVLSQEVRIRNGAVLGEDAYSFGFGPDEDSIRFPCTGGLRIGKYVEIGNNVVISRGVHQNTILRDGSRVNDLAHIGNTVIVEENSLVMAQCDISSRVRIGKACWIGQSAVVRQGVHIADRAMVGAGSVVVKDVPENKVVVGTPAAVIRDRY
jgi:UDP-3-O-[3-hydroxymyristoyl] glucosamine N-acyltransferase LpxD